MNYQTYEALRSEIQEARQFYRTNPLRYPGDPRQIDRILSIALEHPSCDYLQVLDRYSRQFRERPKVNVRNLLREYHLLKEDGRQECNRHLQMSLRNFLDLVESTEEKKVRNAYQGLDGWLVERRKRSIEVVARLTLSQYAARLIEQSGSRQTQELGEMLVQVQDNTLPTFSLRLMRRMVYRIAEEKAVRQHATLNDQLDEMIGSVDAAASTTEQTEERDVEALEVENAELRATLFGLKQELTTLKSQIRQMQESSHDEALIGLLADMNSRTSGYLLDNLANSVKSVVQLTSTGWMPEPVEMESVIYSLKMLIDYLERQGVSPIRDIGSKATVGLADLKDLTYVGSEFVSPEDSKAVIFRASGWTYKGHVISRPQAVEGG